MLEKNLIDNEEIFFMKLALEEARKGFSLGEVPVGAVLVSEGKVVAKAYNLVETNKDPSAHAELLCIRDASKIFDNWRLLKTTLYTTLEPCVMCFGAIMAARVEKLVYAAPDLRHGALGSWVDLSSQKHPTHSLAIKSGVLEDQSATLLKEFFQKRRREKSESKTVSRDF